MVLIGKLMHSASTCLLFKMRGDELNVFMACPYHLIEPNQFKIKIQVLGNQELVLSRPLYATALLFPVQHTFLDFAMGVIQDPEVINDYVDSSGAKVLRELSYLTYNDSLFRDRGMINKNADILYANKSGVVSDFSARILEMNYELGTYEGIELRHQTPFPGGFIKLDVDPFEGFSGSIVVYDNNVIGMVVLSSSISNNSDKHSASYILATDMFYLYPHILQCAKAILRFTNNKPAQLLRLRNYLTFQTLDDDLLPIVNHLGGSFIMNQITSNNPVKHLTLLDIHNYLEVSDLSLTQENISNSIRIKTALNENDEFINYFFEKQQNSQVIIKTARYYEKNSNDRLLTIDFENDPIFSNILDWCFRGDPLAHLELTVETHTMNNNGTLTISDPRTFTFDSASTTDTIFNQNYTRTTMQIPSPFFNKMNSSMILMNSFNLGVQLQWLNSFTVIPYADGSVHFWTNHRGAQPFSAGGTFQVMTHGAAAAYRAAVVTLEQGGPSQAAAAPRRRVIRP